MTSRKNLHGIRTVRIEKDRGEHGICHGQRSCVTILYVLANAHRILAEGCKLQGYRVVNRRFLTLLLVYCALLTAYFVFVNLAGDEKGIGRVIELYLTMPAGIVIEHLFAMIHPPGVFNSTLFFSSMVLNCCFAYALIVFLQIARTAANERGNY